MSSPLEDLALLLDYPADARATYERVADRYEHFRELWIRWFGAEAENEMLADLVASLSPGARVLDAGCGTGALARRVLELAPDVQLTLIDLSPAMLARAADLPAERILGSVLDLPFPEGGFDVVLSAWVIETVPDPIRAVREYLRVLDPAGYLFYTFCSLPGRLFLASRQRPVAPRDSPGLRRPVPPRAGHPWHDCERSHRIRFHGGLTTEVALRKCCTIAEPILPS